MRHDITIRPETPKDYKAIIDLILRSFKEGTDYSVGHFLFSRFPLSRTSDGDHIDSNDIVMLAPVSVHADHFHQHVGCTMLTLGIQKVRECGFKGITVEGDFHFYNRVGFRTSSEYNIYPTSGFAMTEPRCMMCQETYEGSLEGIQGYIVYDMYHNA